MTEPTPRPRRTRAQMLIMVALLVVPFAGLAFGASWQWYVGTMVHLYAVSRWT